jgi:ubiquinone/menaquinone biosynthesis C-methylase UbiE
MNHNGIQDDILFDAGFIEAASGVRFPFYNLSKKKAPLNWNKELDNMIDEPAISHSIDFYERKAVVDQVGSFIKGKDNIIICDFGCSSGYMLRDIKNMNAGVSLIGVDAEENGLIKLNKMDPDIMLFKFDITSIPFPDKILDVVICLNVLEHIENDDAVIKEFGRILQKEGIVCIVVPYGPDLYDYFDKACMHVKRYDRHDLPDKMKNNNFKLIYNNYIGCMAYIPFYIQKKLNRRAFDKLNERERLNKMEEDIKATNDNIILNKIFEVDYKLARHIRYPFGIRQIVVGVNG